MSWRRCAPLPILMVVWSMAGCASGDRGPADMRPDMIRIDAEPPCTAAAIRTCDIDGCPGQARCVDGVFGACAIPAESCNGIDDDCDGQTDEGYSIGETCRVGAGGCATEGVWQCADGDATCDAQPRSARPELCNGLDDDCDSQIDEERDEEQGEAQNEAPLTQACYPGPAGTRNVGVCAAGRAQCIDGDWRACANAIEPTLEVCDGLDNDCDGITDEGPNDAPLTQPCFDGPPEVARVGACRPGVETCVAGAFGECVGAIGPAAELCDNVDDDCDGRVDEAQEDGAACTVGLGPCARDGRMGCVDGIQACDVKPGRPEPEICDQIDNDCDGVIDPEPTCAYFASCRVARDAGHTQNGVYRLRPGPDLSEYPVYCDQQTDGGGWTLVGSSRDMPLNDALANYHPDLRRLDPQDMRDGLWGGLRDLDARFDVRLACRSAVAAADAPFTVDLSHYATNWYGRWTVGEDAVSCIALPDGTGADAIAPARRDNRSGRWLGRNTPWRNGLVVEAECADPAFAFDFEDGGLAGDDPADGTDWGRGGDDMRCGGPVDGGQWFVFVREGSRWRRQQAFRVDDGPNWDGAPSFSCRGACRAQAGLESPMSGFACGIAADFLDRRSHLDGWGEAARFCGGETAPDSFVLPGEGQLYDCGAAACGFSAWVDDHGCGETNRCWRAGAPPAFVPPAANSEGTVGAVVSWRVCAADSGQVEVQSGPGDTDPMAVCAALGYGPAIAFNPACPADCGPCALDDAPPPVQVDAGRWRCLR